MMVDTSHYSPGTQLYEWCRAAQITPSEPVVDQEITDPPGEPPPRFPTGLSELDEKTGGGGYGMTCVAAGPKCGKSMLALSCAIEAARDDVPWRVLYFNAELSRYEMANRVLRYLRQVPSQALANQLSLHSVELGITVPHVLECIGVRLGLDDTNLLVVVDSLNRLVAQSQTIGTDTGYWQTMHMWTEFFRMAAKLSGGKVASVIVSEINTGGRAKGLDIEYAADLLVKIEPQEGDSEYFRVGVPLARSSAGGKLGLFLLDWERGRFIHAD